MSLGGPTLGSVWVDIGGDASGFENTFRQTMASADEQAKSGFAKVNETVTSFGNTVLKTVGGAFAAAGAAGMAGLGIAIKGGLQRLVGIEEARAKLQGLGHDIESIDLIMDNALESVLGTAYRLDDAATTAASAVAAGIAPGEELERVLKLVGDTAQIAGTDFQYMGDRFARVAAQGRLTGDDLFVLGQRGIPILQWLQDEYGVTAEAARKMVSDGKVDFESFAKIIEDNIGGAALQSGQTTMGAFRNMGAAAGRFGAIIAGPVFRQARVFFLAMIRWLDALSAAVQPTMERFEEWLEPAFARALDSMDSFLRGLQGIRGEMDPITGMVLRSGDAANEFGLKLRNAFLWVTDAVRSAVEWFREYEDIIRPVLAAVARGAVLIAGFAAAWAAVAGVIAILTAAAPIAALLGLAAALVRAYESSEEFRLRVGQAFEGLRDLVEPVLEAFRAGAEGFQEALAGGASAMEAFTAGFDVFRGGLSAEGVFDSLRNIFDDLTDWLVGGGGIETLLGAFINAKVRLLEIATDVFSVLADAVLEALPHVIAALQNIIPGVVETLTSLAPQLLEGAVSIFMVLVEAVSEILPQVVDVLLEVIPALLEALMAAVPAVLEAALILFGALAEAIPLLLPSIVEAVFGLLSLLVDTLLDAVPLLLEAAVELLMALAEAIPIVIPELVGAILGALPKLVEAISNAFPLVLEAGVALFLALVDAVLLSLPHIITAVVELIPVIIATLVAAVPQILVAAIELFMGLVLGLAEALPVIVAALVDAVPALVDGLVTAIPILLEGAVDLFLALVDAVFIALPEIILALLEAIPQIAAAIIGAVPVLLLAAIELFMALVDGLKEAGIYLWAGLTELWDEVVEWFKGIPGRLLDAVKAFPEMIADWARESFTRAWEAFKSIFGNSPGPILNWFGEIPGKLIGMVAKFPAMLAKWARDSLREAWANFRRVWDNIMSWFRLLPGRVITALLVLVTRMGRWGRDVIQGAWDGLKERWESVMSWFRGIPDLIRGAIPNPLSILRDAGSKLMEGFRNGIDSAKNLVTGAATRVMSAARGIFPGSPAKEGPFSGRGWTLYSGQAIGEALAQGMRDRLRAVHAASDALASAAEVSALMPDPAAFRDSDALARAMLDQVRAVKAASEALGEAADSDALTRGMLDQVQAVRDAAQALGEAVDSDALTRAMTDRVQVVRDAAQALGEAVRSDALTRGMLSQAQAVKDAATAMADALTRGMLSQVRAVKDAAETLADAAQLSVAMPEPVPVDALDRVDPVGRLRSLTPSQVEAAIAVTEGGPSMTVNQNIYTRDPRRAAGESVRKLRDAVYLGAPFGNGGQSVTIREDDLART